MSDDNQIPKQEPNLPATPLERIVERVLKGGLPEVIAGPAGKAISRLIGGAADVPAAWLEQKAQAIRDETAARSQLVKAMSAAVGKNAVADPALLERAQDSWLGKAYRSQVNREAIAVETVKLLADEPPPAGATEPEADWMNLFEKLAEDATSEKLRATWAQVLAGELRKPKSFSLRTLQFISTLDAGTAEAFEFLAPHASAKGYIYTANKFDFTENYHKIIALREAGLLGSNIAVRHSVIDGELHIPMGSIIIRYRDLAQKSENIETTPLTKIGMELYKALQICPTEEILHEVALCVGKRFLAREAALHKRISAEKFEQNPERTIAIK